MKTIMLPNAKGAILLFLGLNAQLSWIDSFSLVKNAPSAFNRGTKLNNIRQGDTSLFMTSQNTGDQNELTPGTVLTKRYLHRFSPTDSAICSPYFIEERQDFSVLEDKSLLALGEKYLIIRGGVTEESQVVSSNGQYATSFGPALYTVEGLKIDSNDFLPQPWGSSYAMALFCMDHPGIMTGSGLEVGSGNCFGGILSAIGSGLASGVAPSEDVGAPTPNALTSLLMTNSNTKSIEQCISNLRGTSFPETKVGLALFDWNKKIQDTMKNKFNFILGCDCAHNSSSQLARTVAYALKRSPQCSFVYVGAEHDQKSMEGLVTSLGESYEMNTIVKDIVLERIQLIPKISDSLDEVKLRMKEEATNRVGGHAVYTNVESMKYTTIVGYHDEALNEELITSTGSSSGQVVVKVMEKKTEKEIKKEAKMSNEAMVKSWQDRDAEEKALAASLVDAAKIKAEKVKAEIAKRLELKAKAEEAARLATEAEDERKVAEEKSRLAEEASEEARIALETEEAKEMEAETKNIVAGTADEESAVEDVAGASAEAEAEAKARAIEESERLAAEAEAKAKAEEEARVAAEAEATARAEEEAKREAAEAEAKAKAEEEARAVAEAEEKARAEEEAQRVAAEAEAKARAEEEARVAAEAEATARAEEEAKRVAEEAEAKIRAEIEAKQVAEAEAKARATKEEKRKANEIMKKAKAKEEARLASEKKKRMRAEEEAQRVAAEAEKKAKAEEEANRVAEEEKVKNAQIEAKKSAAEKEKNTKVEEEDRIATETDKKARAETSSKKKYNERMKVAKMREEARLAAEKQKKVRAEVEAKREAAEAEKKARAEEDARLIANKEKKERAEIEAKRKAAESKNISEAKIEAKKLAESEKKSRAEEKAKLSKDAQTKKITLEEASNAKAELKAKIAAEAKAKAELDEEDRLIAGTKGGRTPISDMEETAKELASVISRQNAQNTKRNGVKNNLQTAPKPLNGSSKEKKRKNTGRKALEKN